MPLRRGRGSANVVPVRVEEFDYELPQDRIATVPAEPRDAARLLVYDRATDRVEHRVVGDLPDLLRRGDLLVVNDTRVVPWRLRGRRTSGGAVELLLVERRGDGFVGYVKPARRVRPGEPLALEGGALTAWPQQPLGGGLYELRLEAGAGESVDDALERVGRAPLPPYIARGPDEDVASDRARYQTVFAARQGAIAAPTAGLHFTAGLLARLERAGVRRTAVTLHVGLGTFQPIRAARIEDHRMHRERYELPASAAAAVAAARASGGRVVAVGSTALRTLETRALPGRLVAAGSGETDLFVYPGRSLQVVDALLTNFHLPRSTLLVLVAAIVGRERLLDLYRDAIARGYRFYSFGDAMLIT